MLCCAVLCCAVLCLVLCGAVARSSWTWCVPGMFYSLRSQNQSKSYSGLGSGAGLPCVLLELSPISFCCRSLSSFSSFCCRSHSSLTLSLMIFCRRSVPEVRQMRKRELNKSCEKDSPKERVRCWNHFGQFSSHREVNLRSIWGQFEAIWDEFELNLRLIWAQFEVSSRKFERIG